MGGSGECDVKEVMNPLDAWNDGIQRSRAAYLREWHCPCGVLTDRRGYVCTGVRCEKCVAGVGK